MLAWGFGDFKGGEIFPWRNYPLRNYPLRNCPRAKFPPPPCMAKRDCANDGNTSVQNIGVGRAECALESHVAVQALNVSPRPGRAPKADAATPGGRGGAVGQRPRNISGIYKSPDPRWCAPDVVALGVRAEVPFGGA